jgi:hypothetical protein
MTCYKYLLYFKKPDTFQGILFFLLQLDKVNPNNYLHIFNILGPINCPLLYVFYLRYSSNWNPHRLHSELFPPKEKHNVGLLRFDNDHDHICYRFAQVRIFGEKK